MSARLLPDLSFSLQLRLLSNTRKSIEVQRTTSISQKGKNSSLD
jgi:hypothetical protein